MKLGVIGGSGLYDIEEITDMKSVELDTPFGRPSDAFMHGKLDGCEVYFVPRHGRGHRILPSEINHRANICGLKMLGVDRVISMSAVGSLKDEYRPGDIVLPDQFFDRTKASERQTFFGDGVVAHVSFADPTCADLRKVMTETSRQVIAEQWDNKDVRVSEGGTYVNMEGPAFSTRAESHVYRQLGFDIIGMTSLFEAKLCREAELCYQSLAMVTDYDCWKETEAAVSVEILMETLASNTMLAKLILARLVAAVPESKSCECGNGLATAIVTDRTRIPEEVKERLKPIAGKYL